MEELAKAEIRRLKRLLTHFGIDKDKISMLMPVIENTAWMKVKLDQSRDLIRESEIIIDYDNGGGQKGIRENPVFKAYESLWKSYMSGLNVILNVLPAEVAKMETVKANQTKSMLEIVRERHQKEA